MVDYSHQRSALAINLIFPILSTIFVGARIYSRNRSSYFGWDDWTIIVALILAIAYIVPAWMFIKLAGVGLHIWDIPKDQLRSFDDPQVSKVLYAVQLIYSPIVPIVKCSVLLFLHRLGGLLRRYRYAIWILFTINTVVAIICFCLVAFQCTPIAFLWDKSIPGGHCINAPSFFYNSPSITLTTDILILAIPIWMYAGMQIERRLKVFVLGIFSLGLLVTAVAIWRMILFRNLYLKPPSSDPTYTINFTITGVEINVAIITACAPALKPLLRRLFPKLLKPKVKKGGADGDELPPQWDSSAGKSSVSDQSQKQASIVGGHSDEERKASV